VSEPDAMISDWVRELDRYLDLAGRGIAGAAACSFHHVGIAVPSVQRAWEAIARVIGAEADSPVLADPVQRVAALFLVQPATGNRIEVIEPLTASSPISRFLQKSGGGPHHLCFETDDLDGDLHRLKAEGARVVCPPVEACGFHGARIAFCYTRERLLVELAEAPVAYDRIVGGVVAQVRE